MRCKRWGVTFQVAKGGGGGRDFIKSQLGYKEFKGQIHELDKKVFPSKTTEKLMAGVNWTTRKPVGFMQSCCFVFNGNETKT